MTHEEVRGGRLSRLQAAWVVARRDFMTILFSRSFIFFLLGPLFPLVVGSLAGGIGQRVDSEAARPVIGIAMTAPDIEAMLTARQSLAEELGPALPDIVIIRKLKPGDSFDTQTVLARREGNLAAVLTGTPAAPELTATPERLQWWTGPVALIAGAAVQDTPTVYPEVRTQIVAATGASEQRGRLRTAQAGQLILFLLIILLAGMVLSNLVEEKANKVIEILAAAIPMDAVFLGKLFAMLAVSMVGIAVWATVIGTVVGLSGFEGIMGNAIDLSSLPEPGVGWPMFFLLGIAYFAMGYLLLGSVFLAIGSLANTVREVQTMSMPVTMMQVLLFLFASLAVGSSGEPIEWAAIAFPFSSPFTMFARAAQYPELWPHAMALAYQMLWVAITIRLGAALFRKRVMKSGPQGSSRNRGLRALVSSAFSKGSKNVL